MVTINVVKGDTCSVAFRVKDKNGELVQPSDIKKVVFNNVTKNYTKDLKLILNPNVYVLELNSAETADLEDYTNYFNIVVYYTNGEIQTELYNAVLYAFV